MASHDDASAPAPSSGGVPTRPAYARREAAPALHRPEPDRRPRQRPVYAALDLGTNNCRLLIAEPAHSGFRVLDAFSRIVRLGEGLGGSNTLAEAAIARTLDALRICKAKMAARRVGCARLIATEACRLATNGPAFVARVREEVGLNLEIVDRRTEAHLAVAGCAALADPGASAAIVFDIGGGSTEIAWLDGEGVRPRADPCQRIQAWDSLPVGVVTLAERHGGIDVTPRSFEAMVEVVAGHLSGFVAAVSPARAGNGFHLLGTSGTVTTVGGIHLGLARYDRRQVDGLWMQDADVTAVIERLLAASFHERVANPCIGRERADLVLAGCAILEAIRRAFPAERLRIADRGLREGILLNLMREDEAWRSAGRGW